MAGMSRKPAPAYTYRATLVRLVDADSAIFAVDVGFRFRAEVPVRLLGLNAPERYTAAGKVATAWVSAWFERHPEIILSTEKDPEKYGRWLGTVVGADDGEVLNAELIGAGHALAWDGTGRMPT